MPDTDTQTPPPPPPPEAPAPPPAAPRWWDTPVARDRAAGKVGGVAAGLSRAFGFDRRTTRIALVVVSLVMPAFVVAYAIAWVLLPADPAAAVSLRQLLAERRRLPLVLALGLVLAVTGLGSLDWRFGLHGISWGLTLVVLGVLLWATTLRTTTPTRTLPALYEPANHLPLHPEPRARRRRWPWLLLLPVLFLLVPIVLFFSVTQADLRGGIGERTAHPLTVEEFQRDRKLGVGQLVLDLRDLPAGTSSTDVLDVSARVGVGRLRILVPEIATLEVHTDLGAGHVVLDGEEIANGIRSVDDRRVAARGASTVTLRLDLRMGAGEIALERRIGS
jgi:phage shock protein PspC (stress-responsive transcriptional regulator)